MNIKSILLIAIAVFFCLQASLAQGFLKTDGQKIVNPQGDNIILRGMGLGGWMLQEGYMLKIYKDGTQHSIKARIADLIGKEECDRFYSLWLQNHVTKADVDSLAKWGFNSIRLPMHYNLFTLSIEDEPVKGENTWLPLGFQLTDSLLSWCKANKMYLILDLHAAPGGQGKDANISDADTAKPTLWESDLNKKKTIALWRKLAEHYVSEPNIGGYDLLNEPNWTFEGKHKNGVADTLNKPIWDLYIEISKAIREVDKKHIIFIEGNGWGNNYRGFPGPWDDNMVLSFHKYWNANTQGDIAGFIDLRNKYNMPLWLGESGENSNKWFTDCISLIEKNNIGWAWWPLKKIGTVVCPLTIATSDNYDKIVDYWNKGTERPSKEVASKALFEVVENMKAQNCHFNKDIIDAMIRQRIDTTAIPFIKHSVPCKIYASDYDLGYVGKAYFDLDNERVDGGGKKGGNKGRQYRNDGVDIQICTDSSKLSNGYNVMSIENGEWLQYTVDAPKTGSYSILARVASDKETGLMQVEINNILLTVEAEVVNSGNVDDWKTIPVTKVSLNKGKNAIKVIFKKGGFKLNYLELVSN